MKSITSDQKLHLGLWLSIVPILVWSYIGCADVPTWVAETAPVYIGTAVLLFYYKRFQFSRPVCWLLWIHAIILIVGGHYTYAKVPLGNWVRDILELDRNPYDRLGHFFQGFVPAFIARELLLRLRVLAKRGWLFFLVISICLAISACYEFVEWGAALISAEAAESFLGTQGDVWDTQWDMFMASIGASIAFLFSRYHDGAIQAKEKNG